jgi:hypothetical protein
MVALSCAACRAGVVHVPWSWLPRFVTADQAVAHTLRCMYSQSPYSGLAYTAAVTAKFSRLGES